MSQLPTGAVVFENVSKRYRLGALGTLRSTLASLTSRSGDGTREFWALKDVSFRVEPGESLGLIGPNGAGKTTTLKLLSNITQPTSGRIEVSGRMSSLIELGAGFHPELSGRDNVFLNGAILGLKRREIQRKLDAIIAFSELERFIDTPVKRYSSGMYVRLGFAVAAHVEPDILLVDEVLAVGDSAFRQKCMARMESLRSGGTTLVFVSHNMYQVRRLCSRAVLLLQGKAAFLGPTDEAISVYEEDVQSRAQQQEGRREFGPAQQSEIVITNIDVYSDGSDPVTKLRHDQPLNICISYRARQAVPDPIIKVRLIRTDGTVVAMSASRYDPRLKWTLECNGTIRVLFTPVQLVSGRYAAEVRIIDTTDTTVLASGQSGPFVVQGVGMLHETDLGSFVPNVRWHHQPGDPIAK